MEQRLVAEILPRQNLSALPALPTDVCFDDVGPNGAGKSTLFTQGRSHDVPEAKLPGRYERLRPLVVSAVPLCARAVFYDNAAYSGPHEVGAFRFGVRDYPPAWPRWAPEVLRAL